MAKIVTQHFNFEVYESIDELLQTDFNLIKKAREITAMAYAPYSHFLVGAVAQLKNGELVIGSNQENASYPVGICAERVLLSSAASLFPNMPINTIAISYHNLNGTSLVPISPCGMCRQALLEFEERTHQPIRLLLSGMEGKIFEIKEANHLLPLSFGKNDLIG